MQIIKLVQNYNFIGLVAVLIFALTAVIVNKPDPDLEQRVSDLENRVASIEETLTGTGTTDTIAASDRGNQYRENWRQLREGMSPEKVQELLGKPQRIDGGASAIWHYPIGGRVHFSRGKVNRWSEPY
jgi:outer membrane protein assembly factor BamE (lipoprotein component of BamABCDE complex)